MHAHTPTRRQLAGYLAAFGVTAGGGEDQIARTGESIHQEPTIPASGQRVYAALTDAGQFEKVTHLSADGMGMPKGLTVISPQLGGAFSLFGGHIIGRQIELVPAERIVQAWRVVDWKPGIYSIAKFELIEQGTATRIVFDHIGFPVGLAEHLASGWTQHYWEPLAKYFA